MSGYAPIAVTASATLNRSYVGAPIVVNAAAGLTLTLPASAGTGDEYDITIGTTVTSNSVVVKVANATDVMRGVAFQAADGGSTSNAWEATTNDDTITLNGGTTGGIAGDRIVLTDYAAGFWQVRIIGAATGTEATPFSATVS
jgi:hypothetical protein